MLILVLRETLEDAKQLQLAQVVQTWDGMLIYREHKNLLRNPQLIKIGYIFQFMSQQQLQMPATQEKQY